MTTYIAHGSYFLTVANLVMGIELLIYTTIIMLSCFCAFSFLFFFEYTYRILTAKFQNVKGNFIAIIILLLFCSVLLHIGKVSHPLY